jgi:hypothetical protein
MSQPHPPIPEPQPHPGTDPDAPDTDEPRTQSILLPPSQRQNQQPEESASQPAEPADAPSAEPADTWAAPPVEPPAPEQPLPGQPGPTPPATAQFHQPTDHPPYQPQYEASPTPQATGPIDFMPGFGAEPAPASPVGSSTATAPPPSRGPSTSPGGLAGAPRRSPLAAVQRAGRGGTALIPLGLGVLTLVLLQLGLAPDYGSQSLWDALPTWSAFATVAALLVLVPAVAGVTNRLPARAAWRTGAVGLAALGTWWVLVALPVAASDRGFWLTTAVAAAAAALWLAPGRTE